MTAEERIEVLEKQVAALKKAMTDLIDKYNWHDHPYDYSSNSSSYSHDATTARPDSSGRFDDFDLNEAFK